MALSTELYGLKSAGVYRFEKDQSVVQNTVEPLDNIRMLVGFSKTGPFNTPVLINTTKEFTDTFGEIDRSLEKKGSYFHRSCLAALSAGPIYALNLLKLTPEDKVNAVKFATSATCEAQTVNPSDESSLYPYRGMYNIDTFYTPSEESFLTTVGRSNTYIPDVPSTNDILDFTNIGKSPVSVIVTKASDYNASAYNVTAQEWYGKGNVPEFMRDTTLISDFMVDVYVFAGDWGGDFNNAEPYARFASDIKFSKYFDKNSGLKRRKNESDTTDTMLMQFLNEPDVNLIGKYTGCLIPGFVDKNGHNLYIEYLINSDTNVNGLMCAVNEQIFDGDVLIDGDKNGIDMIGHTIYDAMHENDFSQVNFLSYSGNISGDARGTYNMYETSSSSQVCTFSVNNNKYVINGTAFQPRTLQHSTGSGMQPVIAWRDIDENTHKLYVYYYADNGTDYISMSNDPYVVGINDIYNHVKDSGKAYFAFEQKLVPITSAVKSELYTKNDISLREEDRNTTNPDSIQSMLNDEYGQANRAVMNSNPIIKYVFTLASNSNITTEGLTHDEYALDIDFATNFVISNTDGKTDKVMFMECSKVYENRASLGTNDSLKLNNSGSGSTPEKIDIDWRDNAYHVTTICGYTIDNSNYYPDYVIAHLSDCEYDLSSDGIYSFDHEGTCHTLEEGLYVILGAEKFNTTIEVYTEMHGVVAQPNEFIIPVNTDDDAYLNVKVGNYALSKNGSDINGNTKHRLTRIAKITGISDAQGVITHRLVTCQDNVDIVYWNNEVYITEVFNRFVDRFTHYNVFTLNGFTLKASHMPDGTNERQHEILDLLTEESEDSNLYNALIDRELIQFRYLVDTFGYGIESMCKSQYTRLCQGRKSAFAIINMPSVNDFKNSQDPKFTDKNNSVSAEFIAKGGDPSTNPSFLFSLPDKVHGSTWGAYYYPYLKVYSNYTTINVPPAAYVSNNFVAKYGAGSPWTLVAGQNRGVISGNNVIGVESSLIRDNRDWLQPAGINSIIYQNGIGCVIYANKTAQQTPESALSSINCREACIYIQDGIEKILRNYLFETNTAQTRLEIKTLVDNFLDTVKNNGGVYDYKTVMDSSNNTNEVIDHNMGVIDVFVEPVRGLEILVQKLTILRTGAIESGTFE